MASFPVTAGTFLMGRQSPIPYLCACSVVYTSAYSCSVYWLCPVPCVGEWVVVTPTRPCSELYPEDPLGRVICSWSPQRAWVQRLE